MIERWNATYRDGETPAGEVAVFLFGGGCIVDGGEAEGGDVDWESEDVGVEDEEEVIRQCAKDVERLKRDIHKRFQPPRLTW